MMTLAQAHALLPGSVLVGHGTTEVQRVHSDTRSLQAGDLFVALKGERFDAHDFLAQASASGAVAAIAERGLAAAGLPGLQVADTQAALTALARGWRQQFHLPLIAVTGSNGKTTVTQMIAAILRAWLADSAFATTGNLNNHIGVPLTLLRLRHDDTTWHRAGVVELGMNHPGEIAELAAITAPTVALVNNAQREHQEFMASVEAVAYENGAVISALGPAGVAVFPADEEHAPIWHNLAGSRPTLTFALTGPADVTCHAEWTQDHWAVLLETPAGAVTLQLQVAGWHNVKNALAASACALAAGCPLDAIGRGLEGFAPVKGRSQVKRLSRASGDATLIDDTYNANPDSVRAAVINIDDAQGAALVASLPAGLDVWTYSTTRAARLRATEIRYDDGGLRFDLREGDAQVDVRTHLIGDYNVANLLATIGGLRASGVALADAARACIGLTPVPGRMDRVPSAADAPQVVVDYAHTPDALDKALRALQPFAQQRGGALWCVFGCGGNRDQGKRPLMGALAQALAQRVVITSDNPRNEAPAFILLQIVAGLNGSQERVKVIEDRRAAIAHAVRNADARDVILIAGKGHEDYQEIGGVKHRFSDIEEAGAALLQRGGASS